MAIACFRMTKQKGEVTATTVLTIKTISILVTFASVSYITMCKENNIQTQLKHFKFSHSLINLLSESLFEIYSLKKSRLIHLSLVMMLHYSLRLNHVLVNKCAL